VHQFLRTTAIGSTVILGFLCLQHCVSVVWRHLFLGPPCDLVCWQACWADQACCPKAGVAGCMTRSTPTPNISPRDPGTLLLRTTYAATFSPAFSPSPFALGQNEMGFEVAMFIKRSVLPGLHIIRSAHILKHADCFLRIDVVRVKFQRSAKLLFSIFQISGAAVHQS